MEPLVWNATTTKPFGRSRIKEPIRRLIQGYVRTLADAAIGLEFSTSPQKYILGVTDDQYEQIVGNKFKQYVGSIIASTTNPETGEKPTFGQLTQGSITPHVEMIRILATQFSAATGLTVTDTGVVNDANPTSSDAILAQSQTLVGMAEQLNVGNGNALRTIAQMALAIANNVSDYFGNLRTLMYFNFSEAAKRGLSIPYDEQVEMQLSCVRYFIDGQGKRRIIPKEQIKEILGYSPDDSDAIALTFAQGDLENPFRAEMGVFDPNYDFDSAMAAINNSYEWRKA
jgi:hypothetical protein